MKGNRTRRLQTVVLGMALASWGAAAPFVWSAEPAEDGSSGETVEQPESRTSSAEKQNPTPEIFVPTEEVSEDFAVSFPVDI